MASEALTCARSHRRAVASISFVLVVVAAFDVVRTGTAVVHVRGLVRERGE
jgi:hypothetical protein